mgnify:CR=1 FL=1|tara:strand:+ start:5416 stop:8679 length:3264 start_codon:yes stop_codon:yes gene_type:complete
MSANNYSNEQRLKENIRTSSVAEFQNLLGGQSNSNILTFDDPINDTRISISKQDDLHQILQGSVNGTYFTDDIARYILDTDREADQDETKKGLIIYEEGTLVDSKFVSKSKISDALSDVKVTYSKISKSINGKDIEGYGYNTSKGNVTPYVNNSSKFSQVPDRIDNPQITALSFLEGRFSIPSRGSDEINLFFNAIPTLEMSKCVPYLNLTIVYGNAQNEKNNMSLGSFLRFVKNDEGNLVIDQAIQLQDDVSRIASGLASGNVIDIAKGAKSAFGGIQDFLKSSKTKNVGEAGMELFLSPQTLSNSNVNKDAYGETILEPIMPLMTIESFSVAIQGLGYGLYSSKNANLKIHLHDRSRLKDVAPLVSPEQFGETKIIIEYGWSHPEGDIASNNPIGQFLNSLRDVGIFTVASSKMDFLGQGATIDIRMAMQGGDDSNAISVACGKFVQGKVFKPQVESIINRIQKDLNPSAYDKNQLKEIRKKHLLSISAAGSTRSIISYSDYLELLGFAGLGGQDRDDESFTTKVKEIFKIDEYSDPAGQSEKKEGFQPSESGIRLTEAIGSKIQSLYTLNDPFINETIETQTNTPFYKTMQSENDGFPDDVLESTFGAVSGFKGYHNSETESKEITTLGTLILKFVAEPLATTGRYDQIQVCFYRFNNQSAGARIYTTASYPIVIDDFKTALMDRIFKDPNITVNRFLRILDSKIINDFENPVYGLSSEMEMKKKRKNMSYKVLKGMSNEEISEVGLPAEFTNIRDILSDDKKELSKTEKKLFSDWREKIIDDSTKTITNKLNQIYTQDGSTDFIGEPSFVIPDLGVYYESLPAIKPGQSKGNQRKDSDYEDKTILRIHIYDKNHTPNPELLYYQELMTSDTVTTGFSNDSISNNMKSPAEVMKLSAVEIKNAIKTKMPSITYGSEYSNVTKLSLNGMSTSGGSIGNALFLTALQNKDSPQSGHGGISDIDDMQVMPMEASMTCMGMPLLTRGNQLYIDMNSNTTADNMYAIKSVTHSIRSGEFSTDVSLTFVAQNSIKDIRSKIMSVTKSLQKARKIESEVIASAQKEIENLAEAAAEAGYDMKFVHKLKENQ